VKIVIISGSHRVGSQSAKVANYLQQRLTDLALCNSASVMDLATTDLPFWDEGVWSNDEKWQRVWQPLERELAAADGFIVVSPEWGGMVPAKLKNFFLLTSANVVGHKPALIVAVSAGLAGSYPVTELRTSSYKNSKICYLPEHIIVRNVREMLNDTVDPSNELDSYLRPRIDFALNLLKVYAVALQQVHQSDIDFSKYPFGM
jgi:NAD(P)H-dependent FMN reductase